MTELEPFSWTRSKFVKIREFLEIAIFDILAEILILRYGPNFGAIDPIFFCCLIIAYILGSYHDLTWKSDFWVDLRGEDDCAPPRGKFR